MPQSPVVVVMGVSGAGKSTVGRLLAETLRVPFADGDDFHPPANLAAMRAGRALTDHDRWPWLDAIAQWMHTEPAGAVVACSALRRAYRDRLRDAGPDVRFVLLALDSAKLAQRMTDRADHFMPTTLLASQLATLEPLGSDERGFTVDAGPSPAALVATIRGRLGITIVSGR